MVSEIMTPHGFQSCSYVFRVFGSQSFFMRLSKRERNPKIMLNFAEKDDQKVLCHVCVGSTQFASIKRSYVAFLLTSGIRVYIHRSRYGSFGCKRISSKSICSSVIKNERQNLSLVLLTYSGVHFWRPWVFRRRTPRSEVRAVARNLPVHKFPFFVIIKRSISEFSLDSLIARELQRAIICIWGKSHKKETVLKLILQV